MTGSNVEEDKELFKVELKAALNIFTKWQCSTEEKSIILGLKNADVEKFGKVHVELDSSQKDNISFILNIHAALASTFSNPENIYGFMRMKNSNGFFNGRSPIEMLIAENGSNLEKITQIIFNTFEGQHWYDGS